MKILVTGATGFIGSYLVPKLIARGDAVTCLVREPARAQALAALGAELAKGDVTDRASLRAPMQYMDAVFHLAGMYEFGIRDRALMRAINVDGARNTLQVAAEVGVSKIIHTSTGGVFGNTRGLIVEESYRALRSELISEYERTKWDAHYGVAVALQQAGAPVIILQPGVVLGPGDTAPHTAYYEFYFSRIPVMFGANSGFTWAHVDDITSGFVAALERGKQGEAYILAGPSLTIRQAMQMWEPITGIPAPKIWMPGWTAAALAGGLGVVEGMGLTLPLVSEEGLRAVADYTFFVSADKAKRELGWQPRPIEQTFKEVMEYEMAKRGIKRVGAGA